MSAENPYDDYDIYNEWTDDPYDRDPYDDSGDFAFVEDEYDSMDYAGEDGLTYDNSGIDTTAARKGSTEAFPRTMVRQAAAEPIRPDYLDPEPFQQDRGGILRRKNKRGQKRRRGRDVSGDPGYQQAPQTAPRDYQQDPQYAPPGYQQDSQAAPRGRRPRKRRRHGCLITILVLIALVVGTYWVVAHPIDEQLAFSPQEEQTINGKLSWSVPGMPYYLLALGSDAREGEDVSRTDTMILVRVDFWGGKLTLLSIPRDTMVDIPGYGTQKINAAYAFGGVGGAASAVSELTGVPVNHCAVVHFDELVGLVDYLGGVTVNVPEAVEGDEYSGLSIDAGTQTLDGETALLWARTRYSYERGDFQRQENQRILITAIMNRMLSLSPKKIPGALEQLGDLIGTDLRCYDLVPLFLRFKLSNPVVYSTSVPSTTDTVDGVSYVIADDAALSSLMKTIDSGGDPGDPVN